MDRQHWKVLKLQITNKCAKVGNKDQTQRGREATLYICDKDINELLIFLCIFLKAENKILFTIA